MDRRTVAPSPALPPLSADAIPIRLPHYRLRDGGLYFLISRRPTVVLDAGEQRVWESVDGSRSVGDLAGLFPAGCGEAALRRFLESGACALVERSFPAGRRRIVVVEPHMDDAALSLGGTMWSRRDECEFTIVTLAGRNNFTSYFSLERDYFDVDEVSALRRAESALVARALGGRHVALDLPEAPLRYRAGDWTLDWYLRHRRSIAAFVSHSSGPAELLAWTDALRQALRDLPADEVWMPIGVGPHTDHELARNACLALLTESPELMSRCVVRLYQEVPYAAQFPAFTAEIVEELTRSGARLELEQAFVTEAFPDKLRLISMFGSQFKLKAMQPGIEASARAAAGGDGRMAELLYRVLTPPRHLDLVALSVGAREVRELARELGPWLARHRRARRVRVFLRPPAGRWAEDVQWLLDALPRARLDLHVAGDALAEVLEFHSPRVRVRPIGRGAVAWVLAVLRANLSGPAPTLVVTYPDRMREVRLLGRLVPLSDLLAVPSMNCLALAMRSLADAGGARARSAG